MIGVSKVKTYHFTVTVKDNSGKITQEMHTVSETDTPFGAAVALGKVVSFYDSLKDKKQIREYHILEE